MKKLLSLLSLLALVCGNVSGQLFIDFDNGGNQDGGFHTEPGYQSYIANHEVAAEFTTQTYEVEFAISGATTVSITPTWPNTTANTVQQMIDRTPDFDVNWVGDNLNLLTDFLGIDTRTGNGGNGDYDGTTGTPTYMDLTLSGLPAGVYTWTSFHHDTEHVNAPFEIELSTDGGATFGFVGQWEMTDSTAGGDPDSLNPITGAVDPDPHNLPSTATFLINATGDDVVLRFVPLSRLAVHEQIFGINGFELVQDSGGAPPKILLVSENVYSNSRAGMGNPEVEFIAFLEGLGYEVVQTMGEGGTAQFTDAAEGPAGAQAVIDAEGIGLVILSRVANSGNYDDNIAAWNAIETPLLSLSPHTLRDSRWRWFATAAIVDLAGTDIQDLVFVEPNHPFVDGLNTDIFDFPEQLTRIGINNAGNGTVIATDAAGNVALAEWEPGVEFYAGSGQFAGGPRVAFAGHRYHEDDPEGNPIQFETYSENGKAMLAQIIRNLLPLPSGGDGYQEPAGGWTYLFDADTAASGAGGFTALDGTWNHDNGSDEWDGTGIGEGSPGGVSLLDDGGTSYLRIQDTGDPRQHGFADPGSNRKVYFGHSVDADGVTGPILADGFTMSFRARLATGDPLDDRHPDDGTAPTAWPEEGKGYLVHDGGKGNVTVRQAGVGTVSFALTLGDESPTGESGLTMNALNGAVASAAVDPFQGEGTPNVFPVEEPLSEWHEFWVNIVEDLSGGGTHRVDLYVDGNETPSSYHVTAGTGSDFDGNYIAFGAGTTPQIGAWDLDYVAYKEGVHLPRRQGAGTPVAFESQPESLTLLETRPAVFTASVVGTPPRTLQWQRSTDGGATWSDIPGEDTDTYSIASVALTDDGNMFRLFASNPFGTATSDEVLLTVLDDNESPQIVSVSGSGSFDQVTIEFNEPIDTVVGNDLFFYLVLNPATGVPLGNLDLNFSADGTRVFLTTEPMEPDTEYVANVFFGQDLAGNQILVPLEAGFRSWIPSDCGGLLYEVFDGIGAGTAVADLLGAATYPDNPTQVSILSTFATPVDRADNFGGRVRGVFFPPVSGNWIFHLRSDDAGRLLLNPNGPSPAGAEQIVQQTGCCNAIEALFSQPIPLEAGTGYYIEALYKEGGGGDYLQVAVRLEGEPAPTDPIAQAIPASMLGAAAPAGAAGTVTINQQPQSQMVVENRSVELSVGAVSEFGLPLCYQWRKNGVDIPGAILSTYTTDLLTAADSGAEYTVRVSLPGFTAVSDAAVITVEADTTAPVMLGARGGASLRRIVVEFSEPLDLANSGDPFQYLISDGGPTPFSPLSLQVDGTDPEGATLILETPLLTPGTDYMVTAFAISDLSGNQTEQTSADFTSFVISPGFALREFFNTDPALGVTVDDLRASPNFPLNPDMVDYNGFLEGPVDAMDNYGLKISGWLTPKNGGAYDFFMSSDDAGEFWLNLIADDNEPSNLTLIAREPTWNASRDWVGVTRRDPANPENRSTTLYPDGIVLEQGRSYYFEALMKEVGGGDNLGVTAVPHGELPQFGDAPISGSFVMSSGANPDGASIQITQQPMDVALSVGCPTDEDPMMPPPSSGTSFAAPEGGWDYLYDGVGVQGQGVCHNSGAPATPALDGTWVANNGSSEWDGSLRGAGNGMPGGISSDGSVLTLEDINLGSGSCNNRKLYFTHDLSQDLPTLPDNLLDSGVTLTFRARLTQPDTDPAAEIPTPDGWGIFSSGKGNFGVRQTNPSALVSFSLVRESEPDNNFNFTSAGLTMNRLNGDGVLGGEVNSSSVASENQVLALDPNEFHEFWITIQANDDTPGNGTHTVNIYVDGSSEPTTFNVTAGNGSDAASNYVALGLNNSTGQGAFDVDFFGVKAGVVAPATGGASGLFVDFDNGGNQDGGFHAEEGYQSYVANHEVAAEFNAQSFSTVFPNSGAATVTVLPSWPNTTANTVMQLIDRGAANDANWLGDKLNLLTDWLGTDTRTANGGNGAYDGTTGTPTALDLTLSGLPAGSYDWLSYHHDTEHMHSPFRVELSTDGGATFSVVAQSQMTDSTPGGTPDSGTTYMGDIDPDPASLPSTVRFAIDAAGSDVVVRFTPFPGAEVHQQFFGINGFELTQEPSGATRPKLLLVSDNVYSGTRAGTGDPEAEMQAFLESIGYDVIRATGEGGSAQFTESQEGAAGAAASGADLIMISGVANSGNYDADIASWNSLNVPVVLFSPHIARDSRWRWFATSVIVDDSLTDLVYTQPNHPFVDGLATDFYDTATPMTRVGIADAGNGTVIATDAAGNVALAEWQAGVEFYPGSGQFAGARRVYVARHRYHEDDPSGVPIPFEAISQNGKDLLRQILHDVVPVSEGPSEPGTPVEFSVAANGTIAGSDDPPFFVQWQKNGVDIEGANDFTLTTSVTPSDAGAEFRAVLYVPGATVMSDAATVVLNTAPEVAIVSPADGSTGASGVPVTIVAEAMDDGAVVSVEFFVEGLGSLGVDTDGSDGWSVTVADPAPGTYVLTAVATDDSGVSCPSLPVMVELLDNTPPVAVNDTAVTNEDTPVTVDILANDTDAEGDVLTAVLLDGPANGIAALNPDGTVTYTPAPNFFGDDSFTYLANDGSADSEPAMVAISVLSVNDAPTCDPVSGSGDEDTSIAITLLGSDVDGDSLTYTLVEGPSNGSVTVEGNVATYTGDPNFCGTDSFTYLVTDTSGASSDACPVDVTVAGVNDAPIPVVHVNPQADLGEHVSGLIVIAGDGELACVTLDASASSDPDEGTDCGEVSGIESATWLDADGNVLGVGTVIEVCLPVGTQAITLIVDDGQDTSESTVTVEVLTPCEAVEELVMVVENSVIERENKRPFLATLKTACAAFDRGSYGSALNRLSNAFQNKVRAQVGKANPDVAEEWIRIADVIIEATSPYDTQGNPNN